MRTFPFLVIAILVSACSHVSVTKITKENDYTDGIRFYRPEPYFLVTQTTDPKTKTTSLQTTIIYLPNTKEEYVIEPKVRLGTVEMNAKLDGGWNLVSMGQKVDSKIPETIAAVTGTLTAVSGMMRPTKGMPLSLPLKPGLHRLIFGEDGHVVGIQTVALVSP